MDKNGICPKKKVNGELKRNHIMTTKIENSGHKYESCDKCGAFFTSTK